MWTLIITSYVMVEVASGAVHSQIKLTKYDQYESFMDCEIEKSLLKLSFENNENAICIDTKTERKLDEQ